MATRLSHVFGGLVAAWLAGQTAVAWLAWRTWDDLGIGGETWQEVSLAKDLVADVLPPPEYLVEAQLLAHELVVSPPDEREALYARLRTLRTDFETRHAWWQNHLEEAALRRALLTDTWESGGRWFALLDTELRPALDAGDDARAREILHGPMRETYEAHRAAVDRVVVGSTRWLEDTLASAESRSRSSGALLASVTALCAMGAAALAFTFSQRTTHRVGRTIAALDRAAHRDLGVEAPVEGEAEFQALGVALNTTLERFRSDLRGYTTRAEQTDDAARDLRRLGGELTAAADAHLLRAGRLNEGVVEVHEHLTSIAAATGEMTSTIREISRSSAEAALVANESVTTADGASSSLHRLEQSTREITDVVATIRTIAERTHLLALNASIEAARAGQLGRGFAVVANEVKDLAALTTGATGAIVGKVDAIREDCRSVLEGIDRLADSVRRVSALQETVASAVEQQTATSDAIARTAALAAASGTQLQDAAASGVTEATQGREVAESVSRSSDDLGALAQGLRELSSAWVTREGGRRAA